MWNLISSQAFILLPLTTAWGKTTDKKLRKLYMCIHLTSSDIIPTWTQIIFHRVELWQKILKEKTKLSVRIYCLRWRMPWCRMQMSTTHLRPPNSSKNSKPIAWIYAWRCWAIVVSFLMRSILSGNYWHNNRTAWPQHPKFTESLIKKFGIGLIRKNWNQPVKSYMRSKRRLRTCWKIWLEAQHGIWHPWVSERSN